jgi:hypothetical protein
LRHTPRMTQKDARLAELRTAIGERLRGVCSAMPPDAFDALVARMAEVEYKYENYAGNDDLRAEWGLAPLDDAGDASDRA